MGFLHSVTQTCVSIFCLARGEEGKTTKMRLKNVDQKFKHLYEQLQTKCCLFYTHTITFTHLPSLVAVCITSYPQTACTAHAPTHTLRHTLACRQAGHCSVLGKPSAKACQWHPGERAGKHAAVSEAAGLFVIFSKVTRDYRRLTQWKILTEIMMEKDNKAKMYDSSGNPVDKS